MQLNFSLDIEAIAANSLKGQSEQPKQTLYLLVCIAFAMHNMPNQTKCNVPLQVH